MEEVGMRGFGGLENLLVDYQIIETRSRKEFTERKVERVS